MLFPTVEFALFFLCAFAGAWALSGTLWAHKAFLLVGSWLFYGFWDWRFLPVLIGLSLEAALVALALQIPASERVRGWILGVGVSAALSTLMLFKYLVFCTSIALAGFEALGFAVSTSRLPEVALPVGISFFTFHAISLMVDAWRKQISVPVKVLDALLYVAFFPQLVAGPILRASTFLPVLAKGPFDRVDTALALQRIATGLLKKVVLAQVLASALVDPVFESPAEHSSIEVLVGVYGYAAQIYCDFSGYTDLAIGCAALLGYAMPENFNAPYAASSPREFWHRWHISLSTWLRDYLFIPLGGSRGSAFRTTFALTVTMLLGGLWHGAAWTFVAWGAFHGLGLLVHRAWASWAALHAFRLGLFWRVLAPVLTFHFVCLGWVLFRAPNLLVAGDIVSAVLRGSPGSAAWWPVVVVFIALGASFIPSAAFSGLRSRFAGLPLAAQGVVLGLMLVVLDVLSPAGVAPFIYFQF